MLGLAPPRPAERLSTYGQAVLAVLARRGASFVPELVRESGLLLTQVERALAELAALGFVTSDHFAGLRALLTPAAARPSIAGFGRRRRRAAVSFQSGGRWSLLTGIGQPDLDQPGVARTKAIEAHARILLARYGVVFHRLLARETFPFPWRELLLTYRRLEARGEIRGGRFVAEVTGEQFGLPDAVTRLRAVRRAPKTGRWVTIAAVDPLNLVGVVTPGERVAAVARNRIVLEDGRPLAVLDGNELRLLPGGPAERIGELRAALARPLARPMVPGGSKDRGAGSARLEIAADSAG
jgi:ATP-dependent Lhr-like helicase